MPYALVNSARIHFRIIGVKGPYVAAMSGGREPLDEIEEFAEEIAALGYTVILHDRRNCGKSSLDFIDPNAEEDIWESDLCGLLDHLGVGSAFIVGRSRTARVAISFSLRHPERTLALGLWGIGGGAATVRFLDYYYFGQYSKAVLAGGMDEVCEIGHFQQLILQNSETQCARFKFGLGLCQSMTVCTRSFWRNVRAVLSKIANYSTFARIFMLAKTTMVNNRQLPGS